MGTPEKMYADAEKHFEEAKEMLLLNKPSHTLLSVRQSLEAIIYSLCKNAGIATKNENGSVTLVALIDTLREYAVITPDDAANLHRIRMLGNMGVHRTEGPAPSMEQAQEGVYLLSSVLNKCNFYAQNLTPRQQAFLVEQCVKNGKITQAESLALKVLTDGTDSVACAIALYSLCCISGMHNGKTVTEQSLTLQADKGSVTAMGALILWLSQQNPFLFYNFNVSSIEQGQYVVGIVTDCSSHNIELDLGYRMIGYIPTDALYRKIGDYYSGVTRSEVRVGNIIEAYVECQTVLGVQLRDGTLYRENTYTTLLSAGRTIHALFEQICKRDSALAEFLQPKINQSQSALEKVEKLNNEIELKKNPPRTKDTVALEIERKRKPYLRWLAIIPTIILWMILCLVNIRDITEDFDTSGNICIGICIAAFSIGYITYRFFEHTDRKSNQVSQWDWNLKSLSTISPMLIGALLVLIIICEILARWIFSHIIFFLINIFPIICIVASKFTTQNNKTKTDYPMTLMSLWLHAIIPAFIFGVLTAFIAVNGYPLIFICGIFIILVAILKCKSANRCIRTLAAELEQFQMKE